MLNQKNHLFFLFAIFSLSINAQNQYPQIIPSPITEDYFEPEGIPYGTGGDTLCWFPINIGIPQIIGNYPMCGSTQQYRQSWTTSNPDTILPSHWRVGLHQDEHSVMLNDTIHLRYYAENECGIAEERLSVHVADFFLNWPNSIHYESSNPDSLILPVIDVPVPSPILEGIIDGTVDCELIYEDGVWLQSCEVVLDCRPQDTVITVREVSVESNSCDDYFAYAYVTLHETCDHLGYIGTGHAWGLEDISLLWSTGDTGFGLTNVPAGDYSVTITANTPDGQCVFESSVTVENHCDDFCGCEIVEEEAPSDCEAADGRVSITCSQNTGYTYTWSDSSVDTIGQRTDLEAGLGSVTITHENGCSDTLTYSLAACGLWCPLDIVGECGEIELSPQTISIPTYNGNIMNVNQFIDRNPRFDTLPDNSINYSFQRAIKYNWSSDTICIQNITIQNWTPPSVQVDTIYARCGETIDFRDYMSFESCVIDVELVVLREYNDVAYSVIDPVITLAPEDFEILTIAKLLGISFFGVSQHFVIIEEVEEIECPEIEAVHFFNCSWTVSIPEIEVEGCIDSIINTIETPDGFAYHTRKLVVNEPGIYTGSVEIFHENGDYVVRDAGQVEIECQIGPTDPPIGLTTGEGTSLNVYPNPFTNFVSIDRYEGMIKIYDLQGTLLRSTEVYIGDQIDLSNLASGIYFLKTIEETFKLIKK